MTRNKGRIFGKNDYYSIKAGMPLCTKEDTDKIFFILNDYKVEIDGQVVKDSISMNKEYWGFDSWVIKRNDGSLVSNRHLRREIEKVKIKDIEKNWAEKYENHWARIVRDMESVILGSKSSVVKAKYKGYLIRFFVALDWRSVQGNIVFQEEYGRYAEVLKEIGDFPEKERPLPFIDSPFEEIKHYLLLKYYRDYLMDKGVMFDDATMKLRKTTFKFLISDEAMFFYTSDNPAFIYKREDGLYMGVMAITPKILMCIYKCEETYDKYFIKRISDKEVEKYNQIIREHATEYVIRPNIDKLI